MCFAFFTEAPDDRNPGISIQGSWRDSGVSAETREPCPPRRRLSDPGFLKLQAILASDHLEVETAVDAECGLVLFETKEFDLVITDIGLPGMSGIDLCEQIKNHATKRDVPVVLLTSLADPMNIIRGLECGADNFIRKPCEASNFARQGARLP